jgi:solute carrier family 25 (mitochondrial iron transporter), member 28/37
MTPFDVVKQRLQLSSSYNGMYDCARKVYKTEGLKAFYLSYPTTIVQSIPFQMIQFTTYEYACKLINPAGTFSPLTHVIAGGVAGGVASLVTNPLDVAKTLLQTRGASKDVTLRSVGGLAEAMTVIYKRHGAKGYMRGVQARMIANVPSTAVAWTTVSLSDFSMSS